MTHPPRVPPPPPATELPASDGGLRDVVVVGAGFGGLGTALSLAEAGLRVTLCEALKYPGGCASTFTREGRQYEAGATLFSGFDDGQLFGRWIARHRLAVTTLALDPVVELRAPGLVLAVPGQRDAWIERLCLLPGAPAAALARFFALQRRVADALWASFDDPSLLPPLDVRALVRHAGRLGRYAAVVPLLGRPLGAVVRDFGLDGFAPLRLFLDAVCQITVQTSSAEAEAPLALAALDYFFRGTRHVRGGIGELAWALTRAIAQIGGDVQLATAVRALEPCAEGWRVETRRGVLTTRAVVANVLPGDLGRLLRGAPTAPAIDELAQKVAGGWGAIMRYLVLDGAAALPPTPCHLELVADPARPFTDGNHVFCSISGRDEGRGAAGERTVTMSTHVAIPAPDARAAEAPAAQAERVQAAMRATVARLAPELDAATRHEMTGSPRTFARFTRRGGGFVGGIPRRAGLHNYRGLSPRPVLPGLYLVGDSVFPGQSTLATAIGGCRVAAQLVRTLGRG